MVHELTNLLEYKMSLDRYGYYDMQKLSRSKAKELFVIKDGFISKEIQQEVFNKMGWKTKQQAIEATRGLGSYSNENSKEFLAEAISDAITSDKPQEVSKEVLTITKRRLQK